MDSEQIKKNTFSNNIEIIIVFLLLIFVLVLSCIFFYNFMPLVMSNIQSQSVVDILAENNEIHLKSKDLNSVIPLVLFCSYVTILIVTLISIVLIILKIGNTEKSDKVFLLNKVCDEIDKIDINEISEYKEISHKNSYATTVKSNIKADLMKKYMQVIAEL